MLDKAELQDCKIIVSNSLDEHTISSLNIQKACIDSYGVGERLIIINAVYFFQSWICYFFNCSRYFDSRGKSTVFLNGSNFVFGTNGQAAQRSAHRQRRPGISIQKSTKNVR